LICDDYGFEQYKHAAQAAVDEFCKERGVTQIVLPTGQCVLIKTGGDDN
jgi:hypothetical protein